MAQGSDGLSRTLAGGQEELFDWICNQCDDGGKIAEACAYCEDCGRGYCRQCLNLHGQFPLMQRHSVLGTSRKQEWGKTARVTGTGLKCPEHKEECTSMYCGDHDAVCCSVCVSLDHRDCKDMHYIPKICKGIRQSPEFHNTEADIDKTLTEVKKAGIEKKKGKKILDDSRRNVVKTIKDFRLNVLDAFDLLEKRTMKEMDRVYSTVENKLKDDMKICDDYESELNGMKQLHATAGKESQLFVHMKNSQKEIQSYKTVVQHLSTNPELYRFGLTFNPALMQLVTDVKSLGNIITEFPISTRFVISKQDTRKVRNSDDDGYCFISGLCQLPNGRIVCSDYANKKVKLLGNGLCNVIDSCEVPEKPRGMTCTVYPEVAVVLKNRTIQFLCISDCKIVPTRSFPIGDNCYGLAYHTGRFYVSNMRHKVLVYDLTGSLLFSIQKDESGFEILSGPRHIAISADGSKVHIADVHKGLVTVDRDGRHLSTTTDPCLQAAFGVCLDNYENVLVCGVDSSNVVHIRKGGDKVIGEVIGGSDTLAHPISICFDKYLNSLLVTSNPQNGGDSMTVFEFE